MTMIKAIIFDFAGVIGVDGYWIWFKKNIPDLGSKREYYQKVSEQVDRAIIPHSEFMKMLSKDTGIVEEKIWQEVYEEIVINDELLKLIKQLKKKYKIGLLSNFTFPWLREILANRNLYSYFDQIIISSEHKLLKPEPKIFHKILKMLDVIKKEAVFIDDRQTNVDAANRIGIKSILFSSNEHLREQFKEIGIN